MNLTLPQQDIYFEQLLYPNDPIYNIGAKIEIIGELDIEKLKQAYIELINQHDAYRMRLMKKHSRSHSREKIYALVVSVLKNRRIAVILCLTLHHQHVTRYVRKHET